MLYMIHIEPLAERYTTQWRHWFESELIKRGIDHLVIDGVPLAYETSSGQFLDWASRSFYCAAQNQVIAEMFNSGRVVDGDIFFFADIWHPGLESVAYMADMIGIEVKIYAHQHAGVFDRTDLVRPLHYWGKYQEAAWYALCDAVFVGSRFLKGTIIQGIEAAKLPYHFNIVVTGNPYDEADVMLTADAGYFDTKGAPVVVWPHRISPDKNPIDFFHLVNELSPEFPDVRWIMTSGRMSDNFKPPIKQIEFLTLTKENYYALLRKATLLVSTAFHENFGYTIREATTLGTPILCPTRACYPEMIFSLNNLYSSSDELIEKTKAHLACESILDMLPVAELKPNLGIPQILKEMKLVGN